MQTLEDEIIFLLERAAGDLENVDVLVNRSGPIAACAAEQLRVTAIVDHVLEELDQLFDVVLFVAPHLAAGESE